MFALHSGLVFGPSSTSLDNCCNATWHLQYHGFCAVFELLVMEPHLQHLFHKLVLDSYYIFLIYLVLQSVPDVGYSIGFMSALLSGQSIRLFLLLDELLDLFSYMTWRTILLENYSISCITEPLTNLR